AGAVDPGRTGQPGGLVLAAPQACRRRRQQDEATRERSARALRQMGVEASIAQDVEARIGEEAAVAPAGAGMLAKEARELGIRGMLEAEDPLEQDLERLGEAQAGGLATSHCASPS